jgi:hypothetical protein
MSLDAQVEQVADATPQNEQASEGPRVFTVSQILKELTSGLDRTAIRKKYGWTTAEAKLVFGHPKLKSVRVKRSQLIKISLVDDTTEQIREEEEATTNDPHAEDRENTQTEIY